MISGRGGAGELHAELGRKGALYVGGRCVRVGVYMPSLRLLFIESQHIFIGRLHVMQRAVLRRPFCPSVLPSVKCVLSDKTK